MHQAIVTKYLGPTDTRGSRIKATCEAGTLTIGIDYAKSIEANHAEAARLLAVKLGWENARVGGALPGSGYAFVLL